MSIAWAPLRTEENKKSKRCKKKFENKYPAFNVNLCHRLIPFDWIGKRSNKSTSSHQFPKQTMCNYYNMAKLGSFPVSSAVEWHHFQHRLLAYQNGGIATIPWTFCASKTNIIQSINNELMNMCARHRTITNTLPMHCMQLCPTIDCDQFETNGARRYCISHCCRLSVYLLIDGGKFSKWNK